MIVILLSRPSFVHTWRQLLSRFTRETTTVCMVKMGLCPKLKKIENTFYGRSDWNGKHRISHLQSRQGRTNEVHEQLTNRVITPPPYHNGWARLQHRQCSVARVADHRLHLQMKRNRYIIRRKWLILLQANGHLGSVPCRWFEIVTATKQRAGYFLLYIRQPENRVWLLSTVSRRRMTALVSSYGRPALLTTAVVKQLLFISMFAFTSNSQYVYISFSLNICDWSVMWSLVYHKRCVEGNATAIAKGFTQLSSWMIWFY